MKKLLILFVMAGLLFTSCNKNKWIETDYSDEIVGTWTILDSGYACAYVINADGTASSTGMDRESFWENVNGTYKIENNKISMKFDGYSIEGSFDIIPGQTLSIVDTKTGARHTFQYCKEDLSEEIVGMWVCADAPTGDGDAMIVQTYKENGKAIYTGFGSYIDEYLVNDETDYKVIGDLLFYSLPQDELPEGMFPYITMRLTYKPGGTPYGDIMVQESKTMHDGNEVEATSTMLRIKQHLELPGNKYDYSAAYVSNVNGTDEDFTIMGNTFNISNIDNGDFDVILGSSLFYVEFPNANTMKHKYRLNDQDVEFEVPITVEDNKVTLDMSAVNPAYREVDMYMFQDVDNTQLHMYMPTYAFINYFANLELATLLSEGEIDTSDAAAVEKIFADMEARIESINVSFVMKARQ